jgi:serine/threonine protein kinase
VGESPDGRVYAAGELLNGQLLSEMVSGQGPWPVAQAVEICLQAAGGLQAAHRLGVAHGALSPHTILIVPGEDDSPLVKLIGFDFSWYQSDASRNLGQADDDPYSSPERLAGSAPDELSDVFSLGAVLHYLLAGTPPGDGSAPDSIPPRLQPVINRALAAPDQRYPAVAAFAEALSQAAKSPPVQERRQQRRWLASSIVLVLMGTGLWLGRDRFDILADDTAHRMELGARVRESARIAPPRSTPVVMGSTPPASSPAQPRAPSPTKPQAPSPTKPQAPSPTSDRRDPAAGPFVSPFRRAHPWAARPSGRTYFPSSCALALASSELIYFSSEAEARRTGRSRCTAPECS